MNKEEKNTNKNKNKKIPFLIIISYLLSFLVIRLLVTIAGSANTKFAKAVNEGAPGVNFHIGRNIILFGYHIHHFYFGIILVAIAGWISLVKYSKIKIERVAVLYGIGLGLLMDEIGLLLTWGNYYSGLSYLLSLLLLGIFLSILFFPSFWKEIKKEHTKQKDSFFFKKLDLVIKLSDFLSLKFKKTEKIRVYVVGIAYLLVGIFILIYPHFVYYWIAGLFFLQGISLLVKGST